METVVLINKTLISYLDRKLQEMQNVVNRQVCGSDRKQFKAIAMSNVKCSEVIAHENIKSRLYQIESYSILSV